MNPLRKSFSCLFTTMTAAVRAIVLISLEVFLGHADPDKPEIRQMCGEDSVLTCGARHEAGIQYRDVKWYKINDGPQQRLTGLLRKNLLNNSVHRYAGFERSVIFRSNSSDLVLPNVTAEDSGLYKCLFSAPVGHHNQEGMIHLSVFGCTEGALYKDTWLEILLVIALALSLVTCFICWVCLRNLSILRHSRKQDANKEKAPLQKKTLKLIYSPEVKGSPYHHLCV